MRFAVNASVAVKWLVVEEDATVAQELVTSCQDLHVPHLMASEVANKLWRRARMGVL